MPALITISTRASLKKYHTFNLLLGTGDNADDWQFERIGTEREKMQAERERQEIRERLSKVEEWKRRRDEVEAELARVWVDGGDTLDAPEYVAVEQEHEDEVAEAEETASEEPMDESADERFEEADEKFEESVEELGESAVDM